MISLLLSIGQEIMLEEEFWDQIVRNFKKAKEKADCRIEKGLKDHCKQNHIG